MENQPTVLEGHGVRLRPLESVDGDELWRIGHFPELWKWTTNRCASRDDMQRYIDAALAEQIAGTALPFVTIDHKSDKIVGSTRFGNIDRNNRRAEIGWTWITPEFQRSHINTAAKLLMLTHAFDVWKCIRVELKTDRLNEDSRSAMMRIGAKQEGILRRHMITERGRFRDSVYFSIIEEEWEQTRKLLLEKIRSYK